MKRSVEELSGIDTWIFDLDNTLYPANLRLFDQISELMTRFVMDFLELDRTRAAQLQKDYFHAHGTTLKGLMDNHDCDPDEFLAFVHDIDYSPIPEDPRLVDSLGRLPGRKLIFTNGDVPHAERALKQLGLTDMFEVIFDIVASGFIPKPDPAPYRNLVEQHGLSPERCVYFEDIARNLKPAKDMGMTTVWVEGSPYARVRSTGFDHVDHRTGDLTDWLECVALRHI